MMILIIKSSLCCVLAGHRKTQAQQMQEDLATGSRVSFGDGFWATHKAKFSLWNSMFESIQMLHIVYIVPNV